MRSRSRVETGPLFGIQKCYTLPLPASTLRIAPFARFVSLGLICNQTIPTKTMSLLRQLFGPSKQEIWQKLCAEIGGTYIGGFWGGDKVQVSHEQWTITLDTYVVSTGKSTITYTRLRAPYVNPDGFRFTIYRRGFFSDIAKWFGMQDVEIGHENFDRDFIIKGDDTAKLRALFDSAMLRDLLEAQPQVLFAVKDSEGLFGVRFPSDTDELCFTVLGVIKDADRLKLLFELFSETLDQLCRIGSAYKQAPTVKL
jgi:hypothetical protein